MHLKGRQHYRLYAIHKIPTLKVLDFQKVKQSERDRAGKLAASAAGAAMEADARLEAHAAVESSDDAKMPAYSTNGDNGGTNTFEPGEGQTAEQSFATQFTVDEKAKIREMVANAASAEEIDRIESLVKRGIFPGTSEDIPPPPPPPEDGVEDGKRPAEGEGGNDAKRQKSD